MTQFLVTNILEEDFGCEGRPEGYEVKDTVCLRNLEGQELQLQIRDTELYRKKINIGDWVYFDVKDEIHKVS